MGYDVSFHPISPEEMREWYFTPLTWIQQGQEEKVLALAAQYGIDDFYAEKYLQLGNAVFPEIAGGCVCYDKVAFVLLTVGCFCFGVFLLFQPVPDRAGLGIGKHLPLQLPFSVQRLFHLLQLCKAFLHGGISGRTDFVQFLRGRKAVLLIGGNSSCHLL